MNSFIAVQDFMDAFGRGSVPAKQIQLAIDRKAIESAEPRSYSQ
jgi:hypothetical protein